MTNPKVVDSLGDPIIIGNWYGYSRSDSGHSHTTLGKVIKVTDGTRDMYDVPKVRLESCKVMKFNYGRFVGSRKGQKDVTIGAYMVFPVPSQD